MPTQEFIFSTVPVTTILERCRQRLHSIAHPSRRLLEGICLFLAQAMITMSPALSADGDVSGLRQLGAGFSRVYRTTSPSVVHIHSQIAPGDSKINDTSDGSGVVFAPAFPSANDRHYILTSHHVIDRSVHTTVRLSDGREFEANITGSDPKTDIAVIDIAAAGLKPLPMADTDRIQIGQWVLAIGSPFGLKHSLTVGVISGTGRTNIGINDYEDYIQTDAAFSPGNSGGPLINLDGEIVGIISAVLASRDGFTGAGFAIPINLARKVANQLVTIGEVNRAYLGIFLQSLTASLARALGVSDTRGALISEVAPGSPADHAGLQVGDLIVRYRDKPVRDAGSFINDLSLTTPDSKVTLTILRHATRLTLTATVAARRAYERTSTESKKVSAVHLLGMTVSPLTSGLAMRYNLSDHDSRVGNHLVVTSIKPGSPAAKGGLEPGSIVLQVGRSAVSNLDEFSRLVKARHGERQILMLIRQGNMQEFIALEQN